MPANYSNTLLVPEAGYASVNSRQVYDELAIRLAAHPAWSLVDTADFVSGASTYRSYVWKCAAAASGLPADFHLAFRLQFTTIGPAYLTTASLSAILFEGYTLATRTASKPASIMVSAAAVLAADNTHPATWVTTAALPAAFGFSALAPLTAVTSTRVITIVDKDVVTAQMGTAVSTAPLGLYAGAIDTLLPADIDPMPVMLGGTTITASGFSTGGGSGHSFSATRHPTLTGAQTYVFGHGIAMTHNAVNMSLFGEKSPYAAALSNSFGVLGDPASPDNPKFPTGILAGKVPISTSGSTTSPSTRGGLRGFLKHYRSASLIGHTMGDTFVIGGASYVGFGSPVGGLLPVAP